MSDQLTLPLKLRDDAVFASFFPGQNNNLLAFLQAFITAEINFFSAYLWGVPGAGCSHLLQASCQYASERNLNPFYLSFAELTEATPAVLENLENFSLICLDDLQAIIGKREWEEALFVLYNRAQAEKQHLLIGANVPPLQLNYVLPDLKSRLTSGLIFQIQELSDAEKISALRLRAHLRGLELSEEVGEYLLRRAPRELPKLIALLEELDRASLVAQRKLTVPFVKEKLKL